MSTRIQNQGEAHEGIDLLKFPGARGFVVWRGFPYVFQSFFLAAFLLIAWLGWGMYTPDGVPGKLYAKSNLVNLLVWGIWWPIMVWVAVLLGRVWCMVCPLELAANVSERTAARFGARQWKLPRWLRRGWLIVALYLLIQLLVSGIHLHRVPMYTSLFMLLLLGAATAAGALFQNRAFCRGFCPVGLLLGTYGRGGMIAVRPESTRVCADCASKDCISAANRHCPDRRSCPSLLNPAKLNSNTDCLVCGQCLKACQPANMRLLLRPLFSKHDRRDPLAPWPVTLFIMVVSGFVAFEVCGAWPRVETVLLSPAKFVTTRPGFSAHAGWIEGIWSLVIFPLVVWAVLGAISWAAGESANVPDAWRRLALPLVVLISGAHMAKALEKLSTWSPFVLQAVRDPAGVDTAAAIHNQTFAAPAPYLSGPVYGGIGIALVAMALFFALRETRMTHGGTPRVLAAQLVLLGVALGTCVAGWAVR